MKIQYATATNSSPPANERPPPPNSNVRYAVTIMKFTQARERVSIEKKLHDDKLGYKLHVNNYYNTTNTIS